MVAQSSFENLCKNCCHFSGHGAVLKFSGLAFLSLRVPLEIKSSYHLVLSSCYRLLFFSLHNYFY